MGGQPRCPPPIANVARALRRDVLSPSDPRDPSTGPFVRAAALGFGLEFGPVALRIVLGQLLAKRRSLDSLRRALRALVTALFNGLGPRSLAIFFGLSLGGARWLERVVEPVVERYVRSRRPDGEANERTELDADERRRVRIASTAVGSFVSSLGAIILYQSNKRRRAVKPASLINPLPTLPIDGVKPVPAAKGQSPTLELTLFVLVRACDALVRGAYQSLPGRRGALASFVADQMDTIVFAVSCYKIMFSWFYEPHRLPKSYVAWITRLSRMDTRLLELLRHAREGRYIYGQTPSPEVAQMARGIAAHAKAPESFVMPDQTDALRCSIVHGEMLTDSCEMNTIWRWLYGFRMASALYLPVHALPRLFMSGRSLLRSPLSVVLSILLGTARSSAFLATFIASVYAGVCLGRTRLLPKLFPRLPQQTWDSGISPMLGCVLCGFSVLIESKRRRGEMALYVLPRALYATMDDVLPRALSASRRGQLCSLWFERLIFAASTSAVTTVAVHRPALSRGFVRSILSWATGEQWRTYAV